MRVPSSPNQSANPPTPWETEPVVEETGIVEDANVENLYLMGWYLAVNQRNNLVLTKTANPENDLKSNTSSWFKAHCWFLTRDGALWGSVAKVGTGAEYSSSDPVNVQQQQPGSWGGRLWRSPCGNEVLELLH